MEFLSYMQVQLKLNRISQSTYNILCHLIIVVWDWWCFLVQFYKQDISYEDESIRTMFLNRRFFFDIQKKLFTNEAEM